MKRIQAAGGGQGQRGSGCRSQQAVNGSPWGEGSLEEANLETKLDG